MMPSLERDLWKARIRTHDQRTTPFTTQDYWFHISPFFSSCCFQDVIETGITKAKPKRRFQFHGGKNISFLLSLLFFFFAKATVSKPKEHSTWIFPVRLSAGVEACLESLFAQHKKEKKILQNCISKEQTI